MIHACLCGAGRMGTDHAKHITHCRGVTLTAVVDPHLAAASQLAQAYGARAYQSLEAALNDTSIDAVVIASKTETHADLTMEASRAGKAVFCEKPIDLSLEKIDECLKVVAENDTPLLLGFNRRFDPSFSELQQRLRDGGVGKIEQVAISSRDLDLPSREFLKASGGLFHDMMIHDFDMSRWLLGEEPVEVYATGSCLIDPSIAEFGDLDTALVTLKTARGALCQISNSRRSVFGYDQRIEVSGESGLLRAGNLTPTTLEYATSYGVTADCPHPSFPQRYEVAYHREMEHFFYDVLQEGKSPLVTGRDGRQALVIAEAARQSYVEGRPVKIPVLEPELILA